MSEIVDAISRFFTRDAWLDRAAVPLQKLINKIFANGGPIAQKAADLLNGPWLGHPVHPVLTDIPVGAWTAAITLDAMEMSSGRRGIGRAADAAVALGVAGAAGSAITGLADWQHTIGESRRTGFSHALLNTVALGFFVASLAARGSRNRDMGRALALMGFAVVSASAYLGGDLVYRQKIGVNHAPEDIEVNDYVPIMAEDQLPENKLTLGMLNNIPLVLLRRGDRVYALAETCAHLGGPLADGNLVEGSNGEPVVVCPWHASHFNMQNGDVIHGPSAYPQPCFDARINNGQIEVRHRAEEV